VSTDGELAWGWNTDAAAAVAGCRRGALVAGRCWVGVGKGRGLGHAAGYRRIGWKCRAAWIAGVGVVGVGEGSRRGLAGRWCTGERHWSSQS